MRSPIRRITRTPVGETYNFLNDDMLASNRKNVLDMIRLRNRRGELLTEAQNNKKVEAALASMVALDRNSEDYSKTAIDIFELHSTPTKESSRAHIALLLKQNRECKIAAFGIRSGKTPRGIPAKEIYRIFREHPLTDKRSKVQVYEFMGDPVVGFTTIPIVLRPTYNPYDWLDNGDIPYISVGKQKIYVNLSSGKIYRASVPRHSVFASGYRGYRCSHPHQTSAHQFCFGEYNAPIGQAVMDNDYNMLLDIISLFLHQATEEDAAGKSWISWIRSRVATAPTFSDTFISEITVTTDKNGKIISSEKKTPLDELTFSTGTGTAKMFDLWDGSSPIRTGQLCMYNNQYWYAGILDGRIYLTTHHPVCSGSLWLFSLQVQQNELLPTTIEEIPPHTKLAIYNTCVRCGVDNKKTPCWIWDLYDHEEVPRPSLEWYKTFGLPTTPAPLYMRPGTIRPDGPMSMRSQTPVAITDPCDYEPPEELCVYLPDQLLHFAVAGDPVTAGALVIDNKMLLSEDKYFNLSTRNVCFTFESHSHMCTEPVSPYAALVMYLSMNLGGPQYVLSRNELQEIAPHVDLTGNVEPWLRQALCRLFEKQQQEQNATLLK